MAKRRDKARIGKKRRTITLQEKLNIVKRYENGQSVTCIARYFGFAISTICTILKDKDRIKYHAKNSAAMQATVITRKRTGVLHEMEQLLKTWLEDHLQKGVRPSAFTIQDKARSLYNDLSTRKGESKGTFLASSGWFNRFKMRANLDFLTCKSVTVKEDEAENFPEILADVINDGKYVPEQVITVVETQLFWKGIPDGRLKSGSGAKANKDYITLLLGANASGDFKLTPLLIYPAAIPPGPNESSTDSLHVVWSNSKAALTLPIFNSWFWEHFLLETKEYCDKKSIPFRICLILDSTPCHPPCLNSYGPHVKVVHMPPNAASVLQPTDQGMVATFKAHYLHRTFVHALAATEGGMMLAEFWQRHNSYGVLKCIRLAWEDVTTPAVSTPWRTVCPQFAASLTDVEEGTVQELALKVVELAPQLQLQVDLGDVLKLLGLRNETAEGVLCHCQVETEAQMASEEQTSASAACPYLPSSSTPTRGHGDPEDLDWLRRKELNEASKEMASALGRLERIDPHIFKMTRVGRIVRDAFACYKEMCEEKLAASWKSHEGCVVKVECLAEPCFSDTATADVKRDIVDVGGLSQTPSTSSLYDDDDDDDDDSVMKGNIHHDLHPFM